MHEIITQKDFSAGIVLYNPDIDRLIENINAIESQCGFIFFVDNGSKNIDSIEKILENKGNIILIKNNENFGIAKALNQLLELSHSHGYEWLLTLDQDSVAYPNLVEKYCAFLNEQNNEKIISVTCNIVDRNFSVFNKINSEFEDIVYCITSGNAIKVRPVIDISGFDDDMFIDKVDTDICLNIKKHGFRIVQLNIDGVLHEIGHGKKIKLFFRDWEVYNHPAWRRYYMCRNAKYLKFKYHNRYVSKLVLKERFHTFMVFVFENHKMEKLKQAIKGFKDAKKMIRR